MNKAEEILMEYLKGENGKGLSERYAIVAAMEEYAERQLKNCNIQRVVNPVICPNCNEECEPIPLGQMCNKCFYDKMQGKLWFTTACGMLSGAVELQKKLIDN